MIIGILKEDVVDETRIPILPSSVKHLCAIGAEIWIEVGLGDAIDITDLEYLDAGGKLVADRQKILKQSDIILRINKPSLEDVAQLKNGGIHISFFNPFADDELVDSFLENKISAISLEMIPRITRAQKMDVLSSQGSLAGYAMVILAAERLNKILPMMMTPAGTIAPSRVFVLGAGVAGLQAIATAKRLGARVDAFDVRPDTKEQIESLGAKYLDIDLGDTGEASSGYANELTEDQKKKQIEGQKKIIAQSDIVIATAQSMGGLKPAPLLITDDMIEQMKPGSIIVDLAVESGGNVAGVLPNEETIKEGVRLIGYRNMPGMVAINASKMFSENLHNIINEYWDIECKSFVINLEDDILRACVITHAGSIVNKTIKESRGL